jgi:uncharacterized protein YbcI
MRIGRKIREEGRKRKGKKRNEIEMTKGAKFQFVSVSVSVSVNSHVNDTHLVITAEGASSAVTSSCVSRLTGAEQINATRRRLMTSITVQLFETVRQSAVNKRALKGSSREPVYTATVATGGMQDTD